jgi:hypothetical protein
MTEATPVTAAAALGVTGPPPVAVGVDGANPPMTREAAELRKAELLRNADWTERFLAGESRARTEMAALNLALVQTAGNEGQHRRDLEITSLRSRADLSDAHVAEYANLTPVSAAERQFALDKKAQPFGDRAWVAKYLDGDREAAKKPCRQ